MYADLRLGSSFWEDTESLREMPCLKPFVREVPCYWIICEWNYPFPNPTVSRLFISTEYPLAPSGSSSYLIYRDNQDQQTRTHLPMLHRGTWQLTKATNPEEAERTERMEERKQQHYSQPPHRLRLKIIILNIHDTLIGDKEKKFKTRNLKYKNNAVFEHNKFWKLGWETFPKS